MAAAKDKTRTDGTRPIALFAECLLTGVWVALAAVPIVTLPAALAAGARHLAAFLDGEAASLRRFAADTRTAFRDGWRAGLAVVGAAALLAVDLAVLTVEGVPGRAPLALATMLIAALAATVLLRSAAAWRPGASWKDLAAAALADTREDIGGTGILLGGLLVLAVSTWALWILFAPMAGCLVGAALAVHRRRRASS